MIRIDCDCGECIKTDISSDYDVLMHGEDGYYKPNIQCPNCHTKYDVIFHVNINSK